MADSLGVGFVQAMPGDLPLYGIRAKQTGTLQSGFAVSSQERRPFHMPDVHELTGIVHETPRHVH